VTSNPTVDRLAQEMSDLLDAGSVGLYEFMDELNDPEHPLPLDQRKAIARQALDDLLSRDNIEIQRREWGRFDNLGTVRPDELPSDPWQPPGDDGSYLAITRP
jgi:hypothetical protein